MMSLSKVSVVKVASVKQRARPEDGQCAKVDVVDMAFEDWGNPCRDRGHLYRSSQVVSMQRAINVLVSVFDTENK